MKRHLTILWSLELACGLMLTEETQAAHGGWHFAAGVGAETAGQVRAPEGDSIFELKLPLEYEGGNPLDATGGPDAFGYLYVDNTGGDTATFDWIELCGDTLAQNGPTGDNTYMWVSMGTPYIPFYGVYYEWVSVSTNGLLQFITANATAVNRCPFGTTNPANPQIAVYWDDLYAQTNGGCNRNGTAPWIRWRSFPEYFVVEWKDIPHYFNSPDRYSFEAILYRNGRIKLQYLTVLAPNNPNSASIGVDHPSADSGVEYLSCNVNTLPNGTTNRAVWIYPNPDRTGRCCYGDTTCAVTTENECNALSGHWNDGLDCSAPCTTDRPACQEMAVFSQEPRLPGENWGARTSDEGSGYRAYDDYGNVSGPIAGIRVWGFNLLQAGGWGSCSEDPAQFVVKFFNDNGSGQPDTTTAVCDYIVSASPVSTGLVYGGMPIFLQSQYDLELANPCDLSSGWLMIAGTGGGANCWFLWSHALSGMDGSYQLAPPNLVYYPFSLAFCLTAAPCPPPEDVTIRRQSGPGDNMEILFYADGSCYKVWKTAERNNDGDPDGGADAEWSLLSFLQPAPPPGLVTVTDPAPGPYANYVVTAACDCGDQ